MNQAKLTMKNVKIIFFLFLMASTISVIAQRGNMDPKERAKRNTEAMEKRLER